MERTSLESAGELQWGRYKLVFGFGTRYPTGFIDPEGTLYYLKAEQRITLLGQEHSPDTKEITIRIYDPQIENFRDISVDEWKTKYGQKN